MIFKLITVILPWGLKRILLEKVFKYEIDSSAYIGLSWVFPGELRMGPKCRIDHFTVAIHLDKIDMAPGSRVGRSNWITGFSSKDKKHFRHQPERISLLQIGQESAITKHHHIDATSPIIIGSFTTVAGYYSQLLTHSIDVQENRQDSNPIHIGDYCFVGTNTVLLGGSRLPDRSVLGAKALLNKAFTETDTLYGGQPAKKIKAITGKRKYFTREHGYVQ